MDQQYPKHYFYRRIVQAKLFIDQHYAENNELHSIADKAYYSKFHFSRKFKEVYLQRPHQYLVSVRIQQAKKLLASGMSVATVCGAVGFAELSSFSRLFKRHVGLNPSVYIAQRQNFQKQIAENPLSMVPNCFAYQYGWLEKEQFWTNEI